MSSFYADSSEDELVIDKPWLQVEGQLLRFGQKLIQISNIERVTYWIEELPDRPDVDEMKDSGKTMCKRGFLALLAFAVSLLFAILFSKIPAIGDTLGGIFSMLCVICLVVGGILIWQGLKRIAEADAQLREWQKLYDEARKNRYLNIHLVSGKKYPIQFRNAGDLKTAFQTLGNIFKNGGKSTQEYHWEIIDSPGAVIAGRDVNNAS